MSFLKKILTRGILGLAIYLNFAPFAAFARELPRVKSETAVLIDADTGAVLYEKEKDKRMSPASITKILTGLLAVEYGDMDEEITFTRDVLFSIDRSSSHIALQEGETITLEQAMYAMSLESANDAAAGIGAYLEAKSGKSLSRLMNERATRAGAKNSNFVNPHGLYDENHYTTAMDMALIARECIKYDTFNGIFSAGTYTLPPTNKQSETRVFHSGNRYFNSGDDYEGIIMSKIGWVQESGHTMVTRARRGDITLICVVMNSAAKSDKWNDTDRLFDWGFDNYKSVEVTPEYIRLSAPEEIACDSEGRLFVRKEDITAQGVKVLLSKGDDRSAVKAAYSRGTLSRDMKSARFTVTLYTGSADDPHVLATGEATAPVSERSRVFAPIAVAKSHPIIDTVITMLMGLLSFVAAMICDVMISRRI